MRGFLEALGFLTTLPVQRSSGEVWKGVGFFPLVGFILGGALLGADSLLLGRLPKGIESVILLGLLVALTGAVHLDGFIDLCDGLFAPGRTREERLAILKDSRAGSFGVAGGFLLLAAKLAALWELSGAARKAALLLSPSLARWAAVPVILLFPYARREGTGFAFGRAGRGELLLALLLALCFAFGFSGAKGLALLGIVTSSALLEAALIKKKLGGLTGDCYGAIIESCEALSLFLFYFDFGGGVWRGLFS